MKNLTILSGILFISLVGLFFPRVQSTSVEVVPQDTVQFEVAFDHAAELLSPQGIVGFQLPNAGSLKSSIDKLTAALSTIQVKWVSRIHGNLPEIKAFLENVIPNYTKLFLKNRVLIL